MSKKTAKNTVKLNGEAIISYRTKAGLSQEQLAYKAKISSSKTISRCENGGNAYRSTAHNLAEALGVSLEEIIIEEPKEAAQKNAITLTTGETPTATESPANNTVGDKQTLPTNPLQQLLLAIPLSTFGHLDHDTATTLWANISQEPKVDLLENMILLLLENILKTYGRKKYRRFGKVIERLRQQIAPSQKEILQLLRTPRSDFSLLESPISEKAQLFFTQTLIDPLKGKILNDQELLILQTVQPTITQDMYTSYTRTVFNYITQYPLIWENFKKCCKINSTAQIICQMYQNTETRYLFEAIRTPVLQKETNPQDIQEKRHLYLRYLARKFEAIELKGVSPRVQGQDISFNLEEIFIPFEIRGNKNLQNHHIGQNAKSKYNKLLKNAGNLRHKKAELLEQLEKHAKIVLLGDPGGGKSTFLKYITKQVCNYYDTNQLLPFYLPIILKISEYADHIKNNPEKRLIDFLYYEHDKEYAKLIQWAFEHRQVLLLLDGLDEVLDTSQRTRIVDQVEDLVTRMPENRYVVTSRIIGYNEARFGSNFSQLVIQPFDPEQIKTFCISWYKAVAKNSPQYDTNSAIKEANKLNDAITKKPEIQKLACNPLLITIIANIHFKGQSLPHNRAQLYDIAAETLLQYWVQSRVDNEGQLKDKDDIIDLLSPIAFYIHSNNPEGTIEESSFDEECRLLLEGTQYNLTPQQTKSEIKQIKKFLRQQTGFFHEKGIDETSGRRFFGFLHQTFQEYLAAIEVVNRWKEDNIQYDEVLNNTRWTECLRLAAGILKGEKGRAGKQIVTRFVENILNAPGETHQEHCQKVLLVSLILSDNIDITPQNQENFWNAFFTTWNETQDNKLLSEYKTNFVSLLQSKHKIAVQQKLWLLLQDLEHPLCEKIAPTLIENHKTIDEAKQHITNFLKCEKIGVAQTFWDNLYKHIAEYNIYTYEVIIYIDEDQNLSATNPIEQIITYEELIETIDLVPASNFTQLLETIKAVLTSYIYPHNILFANNQRYTKAKRLVEAALKTKSIRTQTAILSILGSFTQLLDNDESRYLQQSLEQIASKTEPNKDLTTQHLETIKERINSLRKRETEQRQVTFNLAELDIKFVPPT